MGKEESILQSQGLFTNTHTYSHMHHQVHKHTHTHHTHNAPCHTARSVKVWMKDHHIRTMSWPVRCLKMNMSLFSLHYPRSENTAFFVILSSRPFSEINALNDNIFILNWVELLSVVYRINQKCSFY